VYNEGRKGELLVEKWVRLYEQKTRSPFIIHKNERIVQNADKGFLGYTLDVHNKDVLITKMCGDGKFWYNRIVDLMKLMKADGWLHCKFSTPRNPEAFKRFVGGEVIDQTVEEGQIVYYFDWTLENGREAYDLGRKG
jgi:hypothetical protein